MGKIIAFSGPRGVGKTSIIHGLRDEHGIRPIVPYTTREPRDHEIEGRDYNFVTPAEFEAVRKTQGMFDVLDLKAGKYGTPLEEFREVARDNGDTLDSIRTIGLAAISAVGLQKEIGSDFVKIVFVLPSSWHQIERQMRDEGMTEEAILQRRSSEPTDLTLIPQFDHIMINSYGAQSDALASAYEYAQSLTTA